MSTTTINPDDLTEAIKQELIDLGRKRITPQRAEQLAELERKFCYTCSSVKELGEFPKNKTAIDGYDYRCSECNRQATRAYRDVYGEVEKQRARKRREQAKAARRFEHRPCIYPVGSKRCPRCDETKNFTQFSCNRSNKDGLDSQCKSCSSEAGKRYRARDGYAQRHNQKMTAYRLAHPWSHRLYKGYQRARDKGLPAEKITRDQLLQYWESIGIDPWVSAYSGQEIPQDQYSIDHVEPLSNPESKGHVLNNLVPCLLGENSSKRNRHFIDLLAKIHD